MRAKGDLAPARALIPWLQVFCASLLYKSFTTEWWQKCSGFCLIIHLPSLQPQRHKIYKNGYFRLSGMVLNLRTLQLTTLTLNEKGQSPT